ncbi:MAG: ABC transporter ATP-binding protein, partial [Planctomycetota bacterium]
MKRLLAYLRPYRWAVVAAAVLLLVLSLLQVAVPYLFQVGIDDYIALGNVDGLGRLVLIFLAVMVAGAAVRWVQTY